MRYRIRNCKDQKEKQRLSSALEFYMKKLIHSNLAKHLHLTIKLNRRMKDCYGECVVTQLNDNQKPRKFLITINPKTEDAAYTLAHEIYHVKQYAYGELSPCHTTWKTLRVNEDKMKYSDLPWEKQAYKYDYILYEEFLAQQK